ncbi:amino acid permease [uncultured Desulfuromusa sp.]|uniref:amino acid permease n=1 Tax=uncultured Desulfuromusa sp. TaxID=219183 RepID=UPI002AA82ADB|nr:amino acid permease [uncultured Desulfuromusa sp.]
MEKNTTSEGLKRNIGLLSATVLVVANMVGSGIFTTSGFIISETGSAKVMLVCWFIGGIFALTGALCYAELGAMLPRSGGEYAYLHKAFGPFPAFLSGWISLIVGFSAPIAAAAIAFSTYFLGTGADPWLQFGGQKTWLVLSPTTLMACMAVLFFSLVHYHSLNLGTGIQNSLTFIKVLFIAAFIAGAVLLGKGDMTHFNLALDTTTGNAASYAVALIFISFAYSGWNAAAYLGGEIRNPGRNLPLSLIMGTLLVITLYMLLNAVFVYALPPAAMTGSLEVGKEAALALFGEKSGQVFSMAIAIGLLSVLSAMIMAGPRVYFAMARDGLFFKRFGIVNTSHQTPAAAIFFQAAVAVFMILCAAYDTLLIYIGFTLSLTAVMTVMALFFLRWKKPELVRPYRTLGYPLTPLIFISGNLWIIAYTLSSRPVVCVAGLLTIGVGAGLYLLFKKSKPDAIISIDKPLGEAVD